jgi:hypothetical protein
LTGPYSLGTVKVMLSEPKYLPSTQCDMGFCNAAIGMGYSPGISDLAAHPSHREDVWAIHQDRWDTMQ